MIVLHLLSLSKCIYLWFLIKCTYQNKAVLFTSVWFYMHAIDRNNYGKSYLLWSTPETTRGNEMTHGNENNTAMCFIEIAIQMLDYLNVIKKKYYANWFHEEVFSMNR